VIELLPLSIGIGLIVSLIFSELFGVAPGGMVVPGYFALRLIHPMDVALTIGAGFATFAIVHALSSILILYGRRRTVLMILVGYLLGMGMRMVFHGNVGALGQEWQIIGFIIPGLIGIWLDRQGVMETISTLLTVSVLVRLVLILAVGAELGTV
jgi:poly-gamma-glutamate biosynthesis protein PgsC/CapC